MIDNITKIKEQICSVGRDLWTLGMVAANDGNISARLPDGNIITTPTGVSKRDMTPDMLIIITPGNDIVSSPLGLRPSSEFKMHLTCYKNRDDIMAVVHAHPPFATGYACAHLALDDYSLSEAVTFMGSVPCAPYATPGTDAVGESIIPYLAEHDTILLMNHGAITVGVDLTSAYFRMETLEHSAKVSFIAKCLGGAYEIPRESIDYLSDVGRKMNIRHPGYKKYNF